MSSARKTLALVESAMQLVNVIEWAHAAGTVADVRVLVLGARHERTRRQLDRVGQLATTVGLDIDTVELRRVGGAVIGDGARLVRDMSRADQVVLGDPFSGLVQLALPFSRPDRVVVVDDGTATWEFRACIDAQRPLLRWRSSHTSSARAARATRMLSPGRLQELTVFSCLAGATPVGAFGLVNSYAWTRARSVPEVRIGQLDIVGVSLAETGVVRRSEYVAALARLVSDKYPTRYLAHRRESAEGLALIATLPGLQVVRPDVPVELALRQGPVAEHVIAFASTAAHTLPVVLADRPVVVEVRPVEPAWFTSATTPHMRRFVQRITDDAPRARLNVA